MVIEHVDTSFSLAISRSLIKVTVLVDQLADVKDLAFAHDTDKIAAREVSCDVSYAIPDVRHGRSVESKTVKKQ